MHPEQINLKKSILAREIFSDYADYDYRGDDPDGNESQERLHYMSPTILRALYAKV